MALRPVTHSHPCRNYPPVMVMDFLRILPGSAKDWNSHRESALAIPLRPAARFFSDQAVSARRRDSVMGRAAPAAAVYRASPNSADPFDSRDSVPGFADSVAAHYSSPASNVERNFPNPSTRLRSFSASRRGLPRSCRDFNGASLAALAIDRPETG